MHKLISGSQGRILDVYKPRSSTGNVSIIPGTGKPNISVPSLVR